jgi:hypothetical protein
MLGVSSTLALLLACSANDTGAAGVESGRDGLTDAGSLAFWPADGSDDARAGWTPTIDGRGDQPSLDQGPTSDGREELASDGGGDAARADEGPFSRTVATALSLTQGDGSHECLVTGASDARAKHLWDEGGYAACDTRGRVVCRRGAKAVITALAQLPTGETERHIACMLDGQRRGSPIIATVYGAIAADGSRVCRVAGDAVATGAGYWDDGEFGYCADEGRVPSCRRGARPVINAKTSLGGNRIKLHVLCILPEQQWDTRIVATIYSESAPDGSSRCRTSQDPVLANAGYWDLGQGQPYGECDAAQQPRCMRGSRKVLSAVTRLPDGRVKHHTACVLSKQLSSDPIVAMLGSRALPRGGATCAGRPEDYWDLQSYGYCTVGNAPACDHDARKLLLGMTTLSDGSVAYRTACVLEAERVGVPAPDDWLETRLDGKVYGWYTHGFYSDADGTYTPFTDNELEYQRFPDNPAPICELGSYTNLGVARTVEDLQKLVACGNYREIIYGLNTTPIVAAIAGGLEHPRFREAFFAAFESYLTELEQLLSRRGLLDDVTIWYIADEPALKRRVFRDQAFLERYAETFRRVIRGGKVAMYFAQDPDGDGVDRGLHYDPPPEVDVMLMGAYFWNNERSCDERAIRDYIYRDNPNTHLDWAFPFDREVYLIGWALTVDGQPPRSCYVEQTWKIFRDDPRITGLVWFIYDAPFVEHALAGAANDTSLLRQIRGLTATR